MLCGLAHAKPHPYFIKYSVNRRALSRITLVQAAPRRGAWVFSSSPAAGVVPAARAGVTRAGALNHAAALLARRPEVAPLHLGRDHRRGVGERRRRRPRRRRGGPVALVGAVRAVGFAAVAIRLGPVVQQEALLRL